MTNDILLEKLAELAVKVGANDQKEQLVAINSSKDISQNLSCIYTRRQPDGAKKVYVNWRDEYVSKYGLINRSEESLKEVPEYLVDRYKHFIKEKGCAISIVSPIPDLNKDVPSNKLQVSGLAFSEALTFYYDHMMSSKSQWSIIAAPNKIWAEKVFPSLKGDEAVNKLWNAILEASRITLDNDPIAEWNAHNERLLKHNKVLNDYNFDTLYFKNSLGTDISVKLVQDHIWAGGGEYTPEGILFNPNIPTEENFTMPHKYGVNGKVVATKPLNYQGKLIEDFWLEFKEGKVVNFDARVNKDALDNLINFDEGSSYLGEIALISYDSPISNSGILFYNTLFDENASCHMALGRAYTINLVDGPNLSKEELKEKGYNNSMSHSDFMFGSKDLSVYGVTDDGKKVEIFRDGDFII